MKTNAGTKPTPTRGANRIGSPLLVAIISSGISFIIVVGYFYFFSKKVIDENDEIDEMDYLSRTPERAAESFIVALSENEIELALRLCKGSTRKALLDGRIFRHLTATVKYAEKTRLTEDKSIRRSITASGDSTREPQKSLGITPSLATTRFSAARAQSTIEQKPSSNSEFPRIDPRMRNKHYLWSEPLVFAIHESHREGKNRILLIGTAEGKNTDRVYLRNIEVTVQISNTHWYVTRVRFK
jgi:hypothetical protein